MTKTKAKFGRIYKKYRKLPDGLKVDQSTWTVRYKGKDYATGETEPKKAEQFLLRLAGQLATGKRVEKLANPTGAVLMNEVLDLRVANGKRKGNKGNKADEGQIDLHLRPFFGSLPANSLTSTHFEKYTDQQLDADLAPASINRTLALLKRALNLAVQRDPPMILRFPKIHMLKVSNARKGFLSHPEYVTLKNTLPPYLVPVFVTAYHVGCRRGELLQVEFRDIEMDAAQPQFRLYPDTTKNGEGRVIPIYGEMVEAFRQQIAMTKRDFPACTFLFHNEGVEIQSFYKAWATATDLAKLDGLLFHDLRRTAVRNLIRSGVDKKVAKEITGHKTDHVFDRYNITNEEDLTGAATKMSAWINTQNAQAAQASLSALIS